MFLASFRPACFYPRNFTLFRNPLSINNGEKHTSCLLRTHLRAFEQARRSCPALHAPYASSQACADTADTARHQTAPRKKKTQLNTKKRSITSERWRSCCWLVCERTSTHAPAHKNAPQSLKEFSDGLLAIGMAGTLSSTTPAGERRTYNAE